MSLLKSFTRSSVRSAHAKLSLRPSIVSLTQSVCYSTPKTKEEVILFILFEVNWLIITSKLRLELNLKDKNLYSVVGKKELMHNMPR